MMPWRIHDELVSPGWIRPQMITVLFLLMLMISLVMVSKGSYRPPSVRVRVVIV